AGLLARLLGPRGAVPRRLHQLAERRRDRHHGERNGANTVWGTLHCGVSPGGPCNETSGIGGNRACPGATCQSAFHTYAIEWDRSVSPQQIRWYVDGQQYHQVSQTQVDATTWANATSHGFFIILNVAMGGGWPGNPTGSTASGVPMLVDYVAVYSS